MLEVGYYKTVKDEFQSLVPTSELASSKLDQRKDDIEGVSFLYIKYYHDNPNLLALLTKLSKRSKEFVGIGEYLGESGPEKEKSKAKIQHRSYFNNTLSSI